MILGIQLNILKGFGSSSVAGSVFLGSPRISPHMFCRLLV